MSEPLPIEIIASDAVPPGTVYLVPLNPDLPRVPDNLTWDRAWFEAWRLFLVENPRMIGVIRDVT